MTALATASLSAVSPWPSIGRTGASTPTFRGTSAPAAILPSVFPSCGALVVLGASLACRTCILRSMGGFEPAVGPGTQAFAGEALAVWFQLVTAGYRLVYEPAALVHPAHRRDYAELRRQIAGYGV